MWNQLVDGLKALWDRFERPILTFIQTLVAVALVAAADAIYAYVTGGGSLTEFNEIGYVAGAAALSAVMLWIRNRFGGKNGENLPPTE